MISNKIIGNDKENVIRSVEHDLMPIIDKLNRKLALKFMYKTQNCLNSQLKSRST